LIEVDAVRGRCAASWPLLSADLQDAGAHWIDAEVVVDPGLITRRNPENLSAFRARVLEDRRANMIKSSAARQRT
jgi:protease I